MSSSGCPALSSVSGALVFAGGEGRFGRAPRRSTGFFGPRLAPAPECFDAWPDELDEVDDVEEPAEPGSAHATGCALALAIPRPMATTERPYRSGIRPAFRGQRELFTITDVPLDIPHGVRVYR
ncbi:hypothetical protein [Mycolicibacterium conceptionense]|uniref:hypothetical protein n=1 Tax=Mycolicibacterium conceptionense TaxID=451644 RepID=UPI001F15AACB|nr:hypothetical protein [Mycolicibacterium conceptionense]